MARKYPDTYTDSATYSDESKFWAAFGAGNKLSSNPITGWQVASMETDVKYNEKTGFYDATCTITYQKARKTQ